MAVMGGPMDAASAPIAKAFNDLGRMKLHVIDLIARSRVDLPDHAVAALEGGESFARMAVVNVLTDGRYDTVPRGSPLPARRFVAAWRFFPGRGFIHVEFEVRGRPADATGDRVAILSMAETSEPPGGVFKPDLGATGG